MADRPASAVSLRSGVSPTALLIKVSQFELDLEIKYRRSVTTDNAPTGGSLVPITVFEWAGGLLRGTGFIDPADTITAQILSSAGITIGGTPGVLSSSFDLQNFRFILDVTESSGSMKGYSFGTAFGDAKIFPTLLTGKADDGGMIEINFELHSQKGIQWRTDLTLL